MNYTYLNNGVKMPMIGLGTYPMKGYKLALTVRNAVKMGYYSFDTSSAYGNEKWLGRGIKICGKHRKDIFITTKLNNYDQHNGDIRAAFQNSLKRLGLKYIDLYLIHWPFPEYYVKSWKKMEQLHNEGLVRAIGVSNFHIKHLEKLLETANIVPAINQVEIHPLLSQSQLVKFCNKTGIKITAYAPLSRMNEKLINNEKLIKISKTHKKNIPQIVLRWDFQHEFISLPKSSNKSRLRDNINIFDFNLSEEEMDIIDNLNIDFRVGLDPDNYDYSKYN